MRLALSSMTGSAFVARGFQERGRKGGFLVEEQYLQCSIPSMAEFNKITQTFRPR